MTETWMRLQAAADEFGWDRRESGQRLTFVRPDGGRIVVWLDAINRVRYAEWRNDGGTGGRIDGGTPAIIAALRTHRPR